MTPIVSFSDSEEASHEYMRLLLTYGPESADLHLIELLRGVFYYKIDVIIGALAASAAQRNDLVSWDPLLCRLNEVINMSPDRNELRHKLQSLAIQPKRDNYQHQILKR